MVAMRHQIGNGIGAVGNLLLHARASIRQVQPEMRARRAPPRDTSCGLPALLRRHHLGGPPPVPCQPLAGFLHVQVDHRGEVEGQELRDQQAADHGETQWASRFGPLPCGHRDIWRPEEEQGQERPEACRRGGCSQSKSRHPRRVARRGVVPRVDPDRSRTSRPRRRPLEPASWRSLPQGQQSTRSPMHASPSALQ
jgi:hypothetical protein